jgi:hypothetical protein
MEKLLTNLEMVTAHCINILSLVGMDLHVPENWWIDTTTGENLKGSRLWKGKIIGVEFPSHGDPLFIFECDEYDPDGPYPMKFSDVLRFWI